MWQRVIALLVLSAAVFLSAFVCTELSWQANLRSLGIVLGGTFMATLIAYPWSRFKELAAALRASFHQSVDHSRRYLDEIVRLARVSRLEGPRGLDVQARKAENGFLRLGLELVADGKGHLEVRDSLEKEYDLHFSRRESQINILQTMARLAPAFGLAGTLVGLINMFGRLDDPSQLGIGMSVALLTTFYGIMVANLLLLPLARKLKEFTRYEAAVMTLIMEGVLAIMDGEHPSAVDHRLSSVFINRRDSVLGLARDRAPERLREAEPTWRLAERWAGK